MSDKDDHGGPGGEVGGGGQGDGGGGGAGGGRGGAGGEGPRDHIKVSPFFNNCDCECDITSKH